MTVFTIKANAGQLLHKAREQTGIDNIDDSEVEAALGILLKSANEQGQMSEMGAAMFEERLQHLLRNRLRMKRDFRAHPEINEQQISRPVIVSGMARTGSTKMQKILAATGDFKYQPFWQGYSMSLISGDRNEDPAPRIKEADEQVRWFNTHAPMAASIHEFSTFEPEEESLIYEHNIVSSYHQAFVFAPDYMMWWVMQDLRPQIDFIKRGLKYLQWQLYDGDPRPGVLKCPMYPGAEHLLREAFPDAVIVCTHRCPHDVLSSVASLLHYYHQAHSDADRKAIYGPMMLEGVAIGLENYMNQRDAHPGTNLFDAAYTDVTRNCEQLIERIYASGRMTLSDKARQGIRQWEKDNSQHKHGVHKHTLEDFQLSNEMVDTRYKKYIDRFGQYF